MRGRAATAAEVWRSLFRIGVGAFWLYFAAQKWPAPLGLNPHGLAWMRPLMQSAATTNPVPGLHSFLVDVVAPNWQLFATLQAVSETLVGLLLVAGLATRAAALVATLLALNLSFTVAFLVSDPGVRWLYYMPVLASFEVFVSGAGALAVDRLRFVPAWAHW